MKNNTKLIMETWRRYLKEESDGIDEPLDNEPEFESDEPVTDSDMSGMDDFQEFDPTGPAPMLDDDDEDDELWSWSQGTDQSDASYERQRGELESRRQAAGFYDTEVPEDSDTFGDMDSDEFYDYSDDSEEY